MKGVRLSAEWEKQEFVQLTWPHEKTDWSYMLDEVEDCFLRIVEQIVCHNQKVVIIADNESLKGHIKHLFEERINCDLVTILVAPSNDTWARDHGGITVFSGKKALVLDYKFNAWGDKFEWQKDNQITSKMASFFDEKGYKVADNGDFILEGGSIETDGEGTLLTTSECLLNKNRNAQLTKEQIEKRLAEDMSFSKFLWLDDGYLAGDDTDSHIDTLARFADNRTILYVECTNEEDEHFQSLKKMREQLNEFIAPNGEKYRLLPLPLPTPIFDEQGERLPATYANFLIINEAVLVPIYGVNEDSLALHQIKLAFADREIIPINCRPLIKQHGSLHCVTMQYPKI